MAVYTGLQQLFEELLGLGKEGTSEDFDVRMRWCWKDRSTDLEDAAVYIQTRLLPADHVQSWIESKSDIGIDERI